MRISRTYPRERQRARMHDFRGIDMASVPSEVALNRASSMENFIYEDGLVRKRHGWTEQARCYYIDNDGQGNYSVKYRKINGLWQFLLNGDRLTIAYADHMFYLVKGKTLTDVTMRSFNKNGAYGYHNKLKPNFKNAKCQAFTRNNKVYFVGMGGYVVLAKYGNYYEFHDVMRDSETTIPTTTTFISNSTIENTSRGLDEPNLLTPMRKNRLVGCDITELNVEYKLDAAIASKTNISIKIEKSDSSIIKLYTDTSSIVEENRAIKLYDDITNKDITLAFRPIYGLTLAGVLFETSKGEKIICTQPSENELVFKYGDAVLAAYNRASKLEFWKLDTSKEYPKTINMGDCGYVTFISLTIDATRAMTATLPSQIKIFDESEVEQGIAYYEAGIVMLKSTLGNLTAKVAGDDNIEVTYTAVTSYKQEDVQHILNANMGAVFGADGDNDRIFLANGTNTDVYSEANDFTYFTAINTITQGSAAIIGYLRLNDGLLAVLKGDDQLDSTMYVRTGEYRYVYDGAGNVIKAVPIFKTIPTNTSIKAVGNTANANLDNDPMFLAQSGVYGVELANNLNTDQRLLRPRSNVIDKGLQALDLKLCTSIAYKGKMYLANENGDCYVADSRFKYQLESDMAGTFNYEWWKWNDVPARVFAVINGELWFGTNDGRLCKFDNAYLDKREHILYAGTITGGNRIVYNRADTKVLEESKYIRFNKVIITKIAKISDMEIVGQESDHKYKVNIPEDKFIAKFYEGVEFVQNLLLIKVIDIDYQNQVIQCDQRIDMSSTGKDLIQKLNGTYLIDDIQETGTYPTYRIKDLRGYVIDNLELTEDSLKYFASIIQVDNVKAVWYTPLTDLGACDIVKSLDTMTIAVDSSSDSPISIGYITRRANDTAIKANYEWDNTDGFSFEDMDFNHFTFIAGSDYTITKKVIARNFVYIMLKIESDSAMPCAIKEIVLHYKYTNNTRGVI